MKADETWDQQSLIHKFSEELSRHQADNILWELHVGLEGREQRDGMGQTRRKHFTT